MAKLYELNHLIATFNLEIDEETGEIANADELDALELERDEKIENIALWIKNLTSDADAISAEAKKLTARAQAAKNKAERLKAYITDNLAGEKFSTPRVAISYRKSQAVKVTDALALPDAYKVVDIKPDKTAIKNAIKAGEKVQGAEVEERVSTIIK